MDSDRATSSSSCLRCPPFCLEGQVGGVSRCWAVCASSLYTQTKQHPTFRGILPILLPWKLPHQGPQSHLLWEREWCHLARPWLCLCSSSSFQETSLEAKISCSALGGHLPSLAHAMVLLQREQRLLWVKWQTWCELLHPKTINLRSWYYLH